MAMDQVLAAVASAMERHNDRQERKEHEHDVLLRENERMRAALGAIARETQRGMMSRERIRGLVVEGLTTTEVEVRVNPRSGHVEMV